MQPRDVLIALFDAAIAATCPQQGIERFLPDQPKGRTIVVGAGKAAAQMAQSLEKLWHEAGHQALSGVVVTRYGYGVPCQSIAVVEAAHPVPDENGLKASALLMAQLRNLTKDDLVIGLFSGGGSALLPFPPVGMSLEDEKTLNDILLKSGAPIEAMNAIRKEFSQIKGGRLGRLSYPAKVVTLIVSDIPGDDPALVASGPMIANPTTRKDALEAIKTYHIPLPNRLLKYFQTAPSDTPLPNDDAFKNHEVHIIASAKLALEAAAKAALIYGYHPLILSDHIEGEAKHVAAQQAQMVRDRALCDHKPMVLLSGGETTVTLGAGAHIGKGGRNSEFSLAFALGIAGLQGVYALAADTDGIDGTENNAGAFISGKTIAEMKQRGIDGQKYLENHDSWSAFAAIDALFCPGPTGTNVNDFRAILIK